jgi:hypothetical protein
MEKIPTLQTWEREIRESKGDGIKSFLRIGRALQAISSGNLWVGSNHDSFEHYCEDVHGFKRSWSYNLIGVWHIFGELLIADSTLQDVEITRLVKLLPLATEANKLDLVHMAATVPDVKGFEANCRNLRGLTAADEEHEHDFQPIAWQVCSICGKKRKSEA